MEDLGRIGIVNGVLRYNGGKEVRSKRSGTTCIECSIQSSIGSWVVNKWAWSA